MKTTIEVCLKNGRCLTVCQEEELTLEDIESFLRRKEEFCVFPKSKYHTDDVFVRQEQIVYITSIVSPEY